MLKKKKKGTPHKGPKGIPSYDSYGSIDASGKDVGVSGVATSAAETGSRNAADVREMQAQFNTANLGPGTRPEQAKDYRSAFIAAGGGQRVNPGFFDSRYTVSPDEIAAAKEYMNRRNPVTGELVNPYARKAFRKTHGGGLLGFLSSGGILGNIIRSIGQKFGLGKRYNEPTYDMSQYSGYGLGGSQTPTYYSDFGNEGLLSLTQTVPTNTDDDSEIQQKYGEYLMDAPPNPLTLQEFKNALDSIKEGTLPNTSTSMFPANNLVTEIQQRDIDLMKTRGGKFLDYDTFKTISGNESLTEEEHAKLKAMV